jgi:ribose 5-phosphate isomerase A
MLVVCDEGKLVATLGAFPLPIEVNPFGLGATRRSVETALAGLGLDGELALRGTSNGPFVTDGGHYILDAALGRIPDPEALAAALVAIPGVVEHGLFINLASAVIVAHSDRVEWLTA